MVYSEAAIVGEVWAKSGNAVFEYAKKPGQKSGQAPKIGNVFRTLPAQTFGAAIYV
jgi:hypothetical protein